MAALAISARPEIIDRIAVSVGSNAISATDLDREIRVTALLNSAVAEFSPATRRSTAERMIEQKLVQRELELSRYPAPEPSAVDEELSDFRQQHHKTDAEFERALADAGVTLQEVKDELLWQLTLLRFVEVRFQPGVQVTDQEIEDYFEKKVKPVAQLAHPGATISLDDYRDDIEETLAGQRADKELDNWLKEMRQRTEIVYHDGAFQ
jgi:hypothetical protein